MSGLDNVTSVGGEFWVENNGLINSLSGLDNLTSIEGYLRVAYNFALTRLDGLNNLTSVGGVFSVDEDSLTSLSSLYSLTSIGGGLYLNSNAILTNLDGLDNVTSIGGNLSITYNNSLISLSGLWGLSSVEGNLILRNNDVLSTLSGLENITSVQGDIKVENNAALTSLTGLDNIDYSTISSLTIIFCPNLFYCEVQSICDFLENNGTASIVQNAPGCNNESEIEIACQTVSTDDLLSNMKLNIQTFPNPFSNAIQIKGSTSDDWSYRIWATTGLLTERYQPVINEQIDLSDLQSGLYFVDLKNKVQVVIKKIIKE